MAAVSDLDELIKSMNPVLNEGAYVYCTVNDMEKIVLQDIICFFREKEGCTVILKKEIADEYALPYSFIASWITLTVHSSLQAVGLTAAFSKALSEKGISCNVVAAFYHDHIFVPQGDALIAMNVLKDLAAAFGKG